LQDWKLQDRKKTDWKLVDWKMDWKMTYYNGDDEVNDKLCVQNIIMFSASAPIWSHTMLNRVDPANSLSIALN